MDMLMETGGTGVQLELHCGGLIKKAKRDMGLAVPTS